MKVGRTVGALVGGLGLWAIRTSVRSSHLRRFMRNKKVIITGGDSGLGLEMTRQLLSLGASVVICGRDRKHLDKAMESLEEQGRVAALVCDVSHSENVSSFVRKAVLYLGGLDILINNAGIIEVGPLSAMNRRDFDQALRVMFWGAYNMVEASLPHLEKGSSIVNITSVGGVIPLPHLLPYSVAKFAAVGFSEGLFQELQERDIHVTTVIPSLMRTGSHWNARFKGDARREYQWFAVAATLPFLAKSAPAAARQILMDVSHRRPVCYVGWQGRLGRILHGTFENSSVRILGRIGQWLNQRGHSFEETEEISGAQAAKRTGPLVVALTASGKPAIRENQPQYGT